MNVIGKDERYELMSKEWQYGGKPDERDQAGMELWPTVFSFRADSGDSWNRRHNWRSWREM
jgi:hypothetical protein